MNHKLNWTPLCWTTSSGCWNNWNRDKKEDDNFIDIEHKFDAVDNAAAEQKKQGDLINLVDDKLDENNPFSDQIKTEDIYIKDKLFDDTNSKDIKKVSDGVIEEINFGDNIEIPSDDEVAVDEPKKIKIIPNPNGVRLASNRIIKKYRKQRQKGSLKKNK